MGVKGEEEDYLCEMCQPRPVSPEVVAIPQPDDALPGCTYYITLMRDDLQIRIGDFVYVHRATLSKQETNDHAVPYTQLKHIPVDQLDIYQVERLWKNETLVC